MRCNSQSPGECFDFLGKFRALYSHFFSVNHTIVIIFFTGKKIRRDCVCLCVCVCVCVCM